MKFYIPNKYLNVSSNYLNHMQKTVVRTFIGRNNEWFEFPMLFMFLNSQSSQRFKITCNSARFVDVVHKDNFFRLKKLFQLQCFLKQSMPFITGIFFLKPFSEKQEISLGHHIQVSSLFLLGLYGGKGKDSKLKIYMGNFSAFIFIPF